MNPLSVAMFAAGAAGSKSKDARIVELEARIAELEAALRAIMEAHGPGTLASDEIYYQALTALLGQNDKEG